MFYNKNQDVIKHLVSVNIFILIIKFNIWKLINSTDVDLNLQFPAGWEQAKKIKYEQDFNKPAPRDFVGYGPLTEPESLAIYNFTLSHNFSLIIAYHTQVKEIYYKKMIIKIITILKIYYTFLNTFLLINIKGEELYP